MKSSSWSSDMYAQLYTALGWTLYPYSGVEVKD